ncbi:SagB/ThcOx family dehydrogenase [Streptosporangium amethystogenes]|uniref:SagB/ThcOx family dehydrogenase n=1 Tax=Streptosporangium amethystogenes TaxID=2002 RepID=UPI00068D730D|nr:SagB family peptide dehydrogenase [Streptosporangium amethystogenes]
MISIALVSHVGIENPDPGVLIFNLDDRRCRLSGLGGADSVLMALRLGPVDVATLSAASDVRLARGALSMMMRRRLIEFRCVDADGEPMRAVPTSDLSKFLARSLDPADRYQLSRFTHLRRSADSLILESVRSLFRVRIERPAVFQVIGMLGRPSRPKDLAAESGVPVESVECWLEFLVAVGIVVPLAGKDVVDEDTDPDLVHREFHDVLLHTHSRYGLTDQRTGAVFPYAGIVPPSPAVRHRFDGPVVPLPRVDLDKLAENDPPLTRVMEERESVRRFGDRGLSLEELGAFLFRTARVREFWPADEGDERGYDVTRRPYPSGGGAYDLEIYLAVRDVEGLVPGLYHYDPAEHELSLVCDDRAVVDKTFQNARYASQSRSTPSVVFTITSRFSRLSWKYRGIAYATTLKNVGVLISAMYAVATAMKLAPCALGDGDAASFGRVTGIDHLVESPVGEFMLGTQVY